MLQLPSDKYHFRRVLENVLLMPCVAVWLYILVFHVPSFWLSAALAFVLGMVNAYLAAWVVFLLGHGMIACLDYWFNGREKDG